LWGFDIFDDIQRLLARQAVSTIFDVGANQGQTALELSGRFPNADVHAFEPDPATFAQLKHATSGVTRIHPHCLGLGSEDAVATLNIAESSEGNSFLELDENRSRHGGWASRQAETTATLHRLDSFCEESDLRRIDLLKIDTQGYEGAVIEGGGAFLHSDNVSVVMLEVDLEPLYKGQAEFSEVLRSMAARGYRLVDFYNKNRSANGQIGWCDALFSGCKGSGDASI